MLFAKSMLNEFKVQNGFQAQNEHVKVFKREMKVMKNPGKHYQSISELIQKN
jgi:hypothetical protein